jgi:hypothetical protein
VLTPNIYRWFYKGGRPNSVAKCLNAISAVLHAWGVAPNLAVTLEVVGRKSRRVIRVPLVMTILAGDRYLVAMLGEAANWVLNLRAAAGHATLVHGRREDVLLEEVPVDLRAPILQAYLHRAPGARPHFPIRYDAPRAQFERIAARFPVFKVLPAKALTNI